MLGTGIEIMLVGMITVFLFLVLLIVSVNLMTYVIQHFFSTKTIDINPLNEDDAYRIAAISVAVHQYRQRDH